MSRRVIYVQAFSQRRGIARRCERVGPRRRRRPELGGAALYWICGFAMGYLTAAVLAAPVWAGK